MPDDTDTAVLIRLLEDALAEADRRRKDIVGALICHAIDILREEPAAGL